MQTNGTPKALKAHRTAQVARLVVVTGRKRPKLPVPQSHTKLITASIVVVAVVGLAGAAAITLRQPKKLIVETPPKEIVKVIEKVVPPPPPPPPVPVKLEAAKPPPAPAAPGPYDGPWRIVSRVRSLPSIVLKQVGDTMSGAYAMEAGVFPFKDGPIQGDTVSFNVTDSLGHQLFFEFKLQEDGSAKVVKYRTAENVVLEIQKVSQRRDLNPQQRRVVMALLQSLGLVPGHERQSLFGLAVGQAATGELFL